MASEQTYALESRFTERAVGVFASSLRASSNPQLRMTTLAALLLLAGGLSVPASSQAEGAGIDASINGESHLVTSNPEMLTGANVANLVGANRFYEAGITGQNTIAANVEAGQIWNGHETLTHVTNYVDDPTTFKTVDGQPEFDKHATWVGMMIGGRNGGTTQGDWQPGIAPGTDLRSGAIASSFGSGGGFTRSDQALATVYGTFFGTADVINSSWGGFDPGGNSPRATITDGLANQNRTTAFVVSAGNSGPGPNTVGSPGSGYNNITVAALQNNNNVYDSVANFSSRAPQDYYDPVNGTVSGVRAAVDIAAPGTNLTSAFYGGQTGGNNPTVTGSTPSSGEPDSYSSGLNGTSFAAPITAGGVALLNSASKAEGFGVDSRDTRVIKSVLMNSADKIPGWNNGQASVNGVITTTQSLDWASGAGALNLDRAYDQYIGAGTRDVAGLSGGLVEAVGWDYGEIGFGLTSSYVMSNYLLGGSLFTVTLDWFRERSFDLQTLTATDLGQANLDLIIRDLVSDTVIAQSISMYNDVEHLSFLLPTTSRYAIDVRYTGNLFGNLTAEQFGLAWYGSVASVPLPGTLALVLAGALCAGFSRRRATATTTVR